MSLATTNTSSSSSVDFLANLLASTTISQDPLPATIEPKCDTVYRAVLNGMTWDKVQHVSKTTSGHKIHRLRARSNNAESNVTIGEHLNLGFNGSAAGKRPVHAVLTPWISFSRSQGWAVFYVLKQQIVFGEDRTLYCLRVPRSQLREYTGNDTRAKSFAKSAQECFGQVYVDIYEHSKVRIEPAVRDAFIAWVAERRQEARDGNNNYTQGGGRRGRGSRGGYVSNRARTATFSYKDWSEHLAQLGLIV